MRRIREWEERWLSRAEKKLWGKSDPPPPPDYVGAAQQQGSANVQAAIVNALLGRMNETTPFGSRQFTRTGQTSVPGIGSQPGFDIPTFESSINLSPEGQQLFDADTAARLGLAQQTGGAVQRVGSAIGSPLSLEGLPSTSNEAVTDAMYRRATRMLDPRYEQAEEAERTRLANAGFSVGNEGFTRAIGNFNRSRDEAYADATDRALLAGQTAGMDQRRQAIQELLLLRQQPLAELSSLRTGAAPQLPQFQPTAGIQPVGAAPISQAVGQAGDYATDVFNVNAAQRNQTLGTAGNLGAGAAAMYLAAMF